MAPTDNPNPLTSGEYHVPPALTSAALCMGYGGLELAMEQVLGASPLWCAEFDDAPSSVIEHHWPGLPNYRDLTAIDWDHVPPVDILTAGYPCQPFSHAGRRKGTADVRHLWPYIADAIRVLRPRFVVLENVAGHLSLGADVVLADLASLLFDAEGVVVRASHVGACHQRARLFIVAADSRSADTQGERCRQGRGRRALEGAEIDGWPSIEPRRRRDAFPAHADRGRLEGGVQRDGRPDEPGLEAPRRRDPHGPDEAPTHPEDVGREGTRGARDRRPGSEDSDRWGNYWPAIRRHELTLGRSAPSPVDVKGRLDPPFVEWMQMLPEGHVCDVPGLSRAKQLKLLGNGVVPPQAAYAVNHLIARLADQREAA